MKNKKPLLIYALSFSLLVSSCSSTGSSVELCLVDNYHGTYEIGQPIDIESFFYCSDRTKAVASVSYKDDQGENRNDVIKGNIYYPQYGTTYVFKYEVGKKSISKSVEVSFSQPLLTVNQSPYISLIGKDIYFEDLLDEIHPNVSPSSTEITVTGVDFSPAEVSLNSKYNYQAIDYESDYFSADGLGNYRVHLLATNGDKTATGTINVETVRSKHEGNDKVLKINDTYCSKNVLLGEKENIFRLPRADYSDASYVVMKDLFKLGDTIGIRFKGKNLPSIGMMVNGNSKNSFSPYAINGYVLSFEAKGTYRYVLAGPNLGGITYKVAVENPSQNRYEYFGTDDLEDDKYYYLTCSISGNKYFQTENVYQHYLSWSCSEILNYGTPDEIYGDPIKQITSSGWNDDKFINDAYMSFYSSPYRDITFEVEYGLKEVEDNVFALDGNKLSSGTYSFKGASIVNDLVNGHVVTSGYLALKGEYSSGSVASFEFKGKNIPSVSLFSDDISGMTGGGKGMFLSPGTKDPNLRKRMTITGPYRLDSSNPSDYDSYNLIGYNNRLYTQTDSVFGRDNLVDEKTYLYVINIASATKTLVSLVLSLYEKIESEYKLISSSPISITGYTGPISGSIIAYPDFEKETTFTYFKVNESPVMPESVYKGTGSNGAVTLYGAGLTFESRYDVGYYGIPNAIQSGSEITISYTGKNMPNVCLFTDSCVGQLIGGGQGVLLGTSYINDVTESTSSSSINPYRLMPFGPYRWSDNHSTSGWDTAYRYADNQLLRKGYGFMEMTDGVHYEYKIKVDSFENGSISLTISMKNVDSNTVTNESSFSLDLVSHLKSDDALNLGNNIVFYGQGVDISFSYSIKK